jgi:membrane-associated phospholipid phosphatase
MLAATPLPHSPRLPFAPRARAQIGLFLLAYVVYSAARFVTIGDLASATDHAHWIVSLERSLGVGVEASVQGALEGTWVMWVLNHLYLVAQLGVVPAALIFLYRCSRALYATLRNTILATWLLSVPVYGLFPVAPPRLAGIGLTDTITAQTSFAMDSNFSTSFYNELAAVPSLHVGFAVAVGIAVAAAVRHPLLKAGALLWGPLIALSVVATGNHYVFDIAAGLVASVAGYGLGVLLAARTRPRRTSAARLVPALADA